MQQFVSIFLNPRTEKSTILFSLLKVLTQFVILNRVTSMIHSVSHLIFRAIIFIDLGADFHLIPFDFFLFLLRYFVLLNHFLFRALSAVLWLEYQSMFHLKLKFSVSSQSQYKLEGRNRLVFFCYKKLWVKGRFLILN